MRGTLSTNVTSDVSSRFIPAMRGTLAKYKANVKTVHPRDAGNMCTVPRLDRVKPVHPRDAGNMPRCGGSCDLQRFIPASAGNIQPDYISIRKCHRFIPASAGNMDKSRRHRLVTVHPRDAGNILRSTCVCPRTGSSPRMRGTFFLYPPTLLPAVHPRVCGEHAAGRSGGWKSGSSPRMRGTCRSPVYNIEHSGSSPRMRGT